MLVLFNYLIICSFTLAYYYGFGCQIRIFRKSQAYLPFGEWKKTPTHTHRFVDDKWVLQSLMGILQQSFSLHSPTLWSRIHSMLFASCQLTNMQCKKTLHLMMMTNGSTSVMGSNESLVVSPWWQLYFFFRVAYRVPVPHINCNLS